MNAMGSLILVTILVFYGNGDPVRIMKFVIPHNLDMDEVDRSIMKSIDNQKPFSFLGNMAVIEKIEHMVNWNQIGNEIKMPTRVDTDTFIKQGIDNKKIFK